MNTWMGRLIFLGWLLRPRLLFGRLYQLSWYRETLERLANDLAPSSRVLEIGCANGDLAHSMARRGFDVTAVDRSARDHWRVSRAQADARQVVFQACDAGCLPFSAATFDAVVSASLLNVVDSPVAVLREMVRVCRPCGQVRVLVPAQGFTVSEATAYVRAQGFNGLEAAAFYTWNRMARKMSHAAVEDLFQQCGLSHITTQAYLGGMVMVVAGCVSSEGVR